MPASSPQFSVTEFGTGLTDVTQGLGPSWLQSCLVRYQAPEQPLHRLREGPLCQYGDRPGVGSSQLHEDLAGAQEFNLGITEKETRVRFRHWSVHVAGIAAVFTAAYNPW